MILIFYRYDISLPLPVFYEVVEVMQKRLNGKVLRCCGYGHIGDGNLHFNVTTDKFSEVSKISFLNSIQFYLFNLVR